MSLLGTPQLEGIDTLIGDEGRYGDRLYTAVALLLGTEYERPTRVCRVPFLRGRHAVQILKTPRSSKKRRTEDDEAAATGGADEPGPGPMQREDTAMDFEPRARPPTPTLSSQPRALRESRRSPRVRESSEPEKERTTPGTPWIQGPTPFGPTGTTRAADPELWVGPATPEIGVHRGRCLTCTYALRVAYPSCSIIPQTRLMSTAVNC